nr:MAG TPA: Lysin motif [Caudoviricetes sp.]
MRKLRLKRLLVVGVLVVSAAVATYSWTHAEETELIEYHKTIEQGDTLWGVVGKVATDKEDMAKLVWQGMKDNHIENPGALQPGTELVIRVKAAREL